MTIAFCLRIAIVSVVTLLFYPVWVVAQPHAKKATRQKATAPETTARGSALQSKIDSHLLEAIAQSKKGKKAAIETPEPADVGADSSGNLSVDISAIVSDSLLHTITALGGKIICPSEEYRTVRAILNLSVVETIAGRKDVTFIQPAVQAHNNATPQPRLQPHSY